LPVITTIGGKKTSYVELNITGKLACSLPQGLLCGAAASRRTSNMRRRGLSPTGFGRRSGFGAGTAAAHVPLLA